MFETMIMSPHYHLEGTLLTKEQVEEISDRISQSVYDDVTKQLEDAISSMQ